MTEARLAPGIEVSTLLVLATVQGGFGAVLCKGDPDRGALKLVLAERGVAVRLLDRQLDRTGSYCWAGKAIDESFELQQHLVRARANDPDLWVLELDIPSAERFVAEMTDSA